MMLYSAAFTRKKTSLSYALLSVFNKVLGTICDLYLGKEGRKKTQLKKKSSAS